MMNVLYLWSDRVGDGHQNRVSASRPSVGIYLEDLLPMVLWASSYLVDEMHISVVGPELSHYKVPGGSGIPFDVRV